MAHTTSIATLCLLVCAVLGSPAVAETLRVTPIQDALATWNGTSYTITDGESSINIEYPSTIPLVHDNRGILQIDLSGLPDGATYLLAWSSMLPASPVAGTTGRTVPR